MCLIFAMEDGFGDWKRWRLHPASPIFWTPSTRLKCHPRVQLNARKKIQIEEVRGQI